MQKLITNILKIMVKIKNHDILNIGMQTMSQKLPVNKSEWIDDTSKFKEDFIKNYN